MHSVGSLGPVLYIHKKLNRNDISLEIHMWKRTKFYNPRRFNLGFTLTVNYYKFLDALASLDVALVCMSVSYLKIC